MKTDEPNQWNRPALVAATFGLAMAVTGCARTAEPDERLIRDLSARLERDRQHGPGIDPATSPATAEADLEVPQGAGPAQYVTLALARNPRLSAAQARVRRLAARVPQETSLEDPMVMVTPLGAMAQTAAGEVGLMLGASQMLPLPQKLAARGEVARRETAAALVEVTALRQEIAAQARRAFWMYWLADQQIETVGQSRDLLATLQESAEAALRAGRATQGDLLRVSTELANLENELIDLEQDRRVAAAALNRLLDRHGDAPLPDPPQMTPQTVDGALVGGLEALLSESAAQNPRLAATVQEIGASRAQVRLARLGWWPDLTISANYNVVRAEGLAMNPTGEDQWSVGFELNVPLWQGRRRAAVREANAAVHEGLARYRSEQNEVAYAVQAALAEVDARRRLVTLFGETVLPQARQTVETVAAGYRAGNSGFLDYIEAWRRLLEFELAQRQAVADLGQAAAELEMALGREPLRSATTTTHPENGGM